MIKKLINKKKVYNDKKMSERLNKSVYGCFLKNTEKLLKDSVSNDEEICQKIK